MSENKGIPQKIIGLMDIFYPLFKRFFDPTTYYYAVCGVSNMVLSWILFFVFNNLIFQKKIWNLPFYKMQLSSYTISATICFVISFIIGFSLLKFVVFTASEIKGKTQLFRYSQSALISFVCSWSLLKLFIVYFGFYQTVSNILASIIVVVISYLIQRNYTFK